MKEFKTIDERTILYYAWETILERKHREMERLKARPDNELIKMHIEKLEEQENEIHARICEIETA